MEKVSEQLRAAKALIVDPEHWTTGAFARDRFGVVCHETDEAAYSFCSEGCLARIQYQRPQVSDSWPNLRAYQYLCAASGELFGIASYMIANDARTHAEVMQMWDLAISLAEKDELFPGV